MRPCAIVESKSRGQNLRSDSTYWIYQYGKRHVLAVPRSQRQVRAAGVASIPAHTRLSRFYKSFLKGVAAVGLDRMVVTPHATPVPRFAGFQWDAFVDVLAGILARRDFETVVVQPPQSQRNRFYVHAFSRLGTRLAFAKVSTDEANDRQLEREAVVLAELENADFVSFRAPALLATGNFDGRRYLVLGPLPERAALMAPLWSPEIEAIHNEISAEAREVKSRESLTWWPDFLARAYEVPQLVALLDQTKDVPMAVSRSHGDFTQWNLYAALDTHWLFDWESYAVDAPVLADRLRFHLGLKTRLVTTQAGEVAGFLYSQFQCSEPERNLRFLRALAFLHARGVAAATEIAQAWSSVPRA